MRVLVTGAAGFIGSHLTRRIACEGDSVWAVTSPGENTDRLADILDRVSVMPVELRDARAVQDLASALRPDCAVHLAWYLTPGEFWTAPENLDCVAMSLSLVAALARAGCKRFVGVGTCFEYDSDYGFLSENITPCRPSSLYGVCKNATYEILQAYCRKAAMPLAWARIFHLYGPAEAEVRLVPGVILALLNGQVARCTHGEQIRDYLHVEDVASALWAIAKSEVCGPVNVGSGQPVTVRKIVETIAHYLKREKDVAFGALPTDPQEPPLLVADVRRLANEIGWKPALTLDEGVAKTCEWWRTRVGH
jgi:nucleoside-diphosphate-sugar epimerase